jgi:hypothetical protein
MGIIWAYAIMLRGHARTTALAAMTAAIMRILLEAFERCILAYPPSVEEFEINATTEGLACQEDAVCVVS